jgi:16S rRNA A1518/A1519 N6-dimethyltransferase RsmA/KsgA/DIM1 with predicted DNA glycosylase/AP lyase activity
LPWALEGIKLGHDVLEIGPGPGLTTDWLQDHPIRLTCLEVDRDFARQLGRRAATSRIRVHCGDATAMPYRNCTFSTIVSFTMLHHLASPALQDRLLGEVYRVLKPGSAEGGAAVRDSHIPM